MDLNKESLEKQFEVVKQETNTSHVMQYGDLVGCFDIIAFLVVYFIYTSCQPSIVDESPWDTCVFSVFY